MERRFISTAASPVTVEKRGDGGQRFIVGLGAVFHNADDEGTEFRLWDDVVERIMPGAFGGSLERPDDVRGLFNHDPDNLLGRNSAGTLSLSVDKRGLRYEIAVDENDPDHQRVVSKIERGDLTGSSFSFIPTDQRWIDGEEDEPDVREIHAVQLYDVGPVTFPAYESADSGMRAVGDVAEVRSAYDAWKAEKREDEPQADDTPEDEYDQDAIKRRNRARVVELDD